MNWQTKKKKGRRANLFSLLFFLFRLVRGHVAFIIRMGGVLGCLGGDGGDSNPIDEDMAQQIGETLVDALIDFPDVFEEEKWQLEWDVWETRDGEYKDEVFGDTVKWAEWPGNDDQFNVLALKRAASTSLKGVLTDIIHAMVDDKIDEKVSSLPEIAQRAAKKAADKVIEKSVDEAVDEAIKRLREYLEKNKDKFQKKIEEGVSRVKGDNPGLVKIKAKKGARKLK